MSLTQTMIANHYCIISPPIYFNPPHHQKIDDILHYEPAAVVDMALQRLQTAEIVLIEWRSLLYRRMNVPVLVKDYSYVVPDEQLEVASDILSSMGLPLSYPSKLLLRTEGDFQAKGRFHRITRWTLPSSIQHLALYPQSFSTLSESELEKKPPYLLCFTSARCQYIYVPSRPAVYASIIRLISKYPKYCATTTVLHSDLSELIGYDLLGLEDGYLDPNDEEEWAAKGVDRRLAQGVQIVMGWGIDDMWRPGEEWIGDALGAIVAGNGSIEYLPCKD